MSTRVIEANQASPMACRNSPVTTNGLPPHRSASMPTTGASSMGMAVHGSTRMPAASGVSPCTVWRNWVRKKMDPNIPKLNSMAVTFTAVKPRWRNSRMFNMGCDGPELPGHEPGQCDDADDEGGEHRGARPAVAVAPHQAEDDAEQADADQGHTAPGPDGWRAPLDSRQLPPGQRDQHDPHRHVEPEDVLPRPTAGDRSADQRPEGHRGHRRWLPRCRGRRCVAPVAPPR